MHKESSGALKIAITATYVDQARARRWIAPDTNNRKREREGESERENESDKRL